MNCYWKTEGFYGMFFPLHKLIDEWSGHWGIFWALMAICILVIWLGHKAIKDD